MTSLTAFNFNNNQVRILVIDGEPWFVAKDVAEIFDYADLSKMLNLVDAEDKDIINPKKIDSAILAESLIAILSKFQSLMSLDYMLVSLEAINHKLKSLSGG
jgi:prophage antirepressor-like protein